MKHTGQRTWLLNPTPESSPTQTTIIKTVLTVIYKRNSACQLSPILSGSPGIGLN